MKDLSIIIPSYNESESLPKLINWIKDEIHSKQLTYEIIIVDDGSTDDSWETIKAIKNKYESIKAIRFRKNYGKSSALNTGFKMSDAEVVLTMDADLQDSPSEIIPLYKMIKKEGFDMVSGWKKKRKDPLSKTIPSKLFNYVTRILTGIKLHDFNCGLKAYSNTLVKNLEIYGEMHRYIPIIAKRNGFNKIGEKVVVHNAREFGVSKFGARRFMTGFLDLIAVIFIEKFAKNPFHFFGVLGVISFFIGLIITSWIIVQKLLAIANNSAYRNVTDQPLFYIALLLSLIGVQLFLTGFIAEIFVRNKVKKEEYNIKNQL